MFSITSVLSLALAVSSVVGGAIPLHHRAMYRSTDLERRGYAENGNLLEPYEIYHKRYLRLDCEAKHNTSFFASCCHPFLKTQSEKDLPAMCHRNHTSASGTLPTSTYVLPPASSDVGSSSSSSSSSSSGNGSDDGGASSSSTSSSSSGSDDDCDENDPNCECTDGDGDDGGDDYPTSSYSWFSAGAYSYSYSDPSTPTASANAQDAGPTSTYVQSSSAADSQYTPSSAAAAANSESTPGGSDSSSGSASSSGSSDGNQVETGGFATYFYQNGNAGACGNYNSDSALIAAIDVAWYGNTGVTSPLCGKQVAITNTQNGKSVTVTIADACPTCDNANSIDLSVGAFQQLADLSEGLVPITWSFV